MGACDVAHGKHTGGLGYISERHKESGRFRLLCELVSVLVKNSVLLHPERSTKTEL